jgi:hypothetical protein
MTPAAPVKLGVELPGYAEARAEAAELTQVVPTEYRADLVVQLWEERPRLAGGAALGGRGEAVHVVRSVQELFESASP